MTEKPLRAEELGQLVRQRRVKDGLSLRDAAKQAEVSFNTLARVERGHIPDLANFRRIVDWLGVSPDRFFEPPLRWWESTPDVIAKHLQSDPHLSDEAAGRIAEIVRDLYSVLVRQDDRLAIHLRAAKTFKPRAANLLAELLEEMQRVLLSEEESDAQAGIQS